MSTGTAYPYGGCSYLEVIVDHKYVSVDQQLFERYLKSDASSDVFIAQGEFEAKFLSAVEQKIKESGELFLNRMEIVTEYPITLLSEKAILSICAAHGYKAATENRSSRLEYLGSDGGGHYSTDYYRILQYGHITVSVL